MAMVFSVRHFWCILSLLSFSVQAQPSEIACLTTNIFFEARGESLRGMQAIADVTLNRVAHTAFPDSICGVVLQPNQFSWVRGNRKAAMRMLRGDLRGLNSKEASAYQKSKELAVAALTDGYKPMLPRNIVSFHNRGVVPSWSTTMQRYAIIGNHVFYSFKRKGK